MTADPRSRMAADQTRPHPLCGPVDTRYSLSLRDVEELLVERSNYRMTFTSGDSFVHFPSESLIDEALGRGVPAAHPRIPSAPLPLLRTRHRACNVQRVHVAPASVCPWLALWPDKCVPSRLGEPRSHPAEVRASFNPDRSIVMVSATTYWGLYSRIKVCASGSGFSRASGKNSASNEEATTQFALRTGDPSRRYRTRLVRSTLVSSICPRFVKTGKT